MAYKHKADAAAAQKRWREKHKVSIDNYLRKSSESNNSEH